jgi:hypothetical protein
MQGPVKKMRSSSYRAVTPRPPKGQTDSDNAKGPPTRRKPRAPRLGQRQGPSDSEKAKGPPTRTTPRALPLGQRAGPSESAPRPSACLRDPPRAEHAVQVSHPTGMPGSWRFTAKPAGRDGRRDCLDGQIRASAPGPPGIPFHGLGIRLELGPLARDFVGRDVPATGSAATGQRQET